jgi:hypothetical protein
LVLVMTDLDQLHTSTSHARARARSIWVRNSVPNLEVLPSPVTTAKVPGR